MLLNKIFTKTTKPRNPTRKSSFPVNPAKFYCIYCQKIGSSNGSVEPAAKAWLSQKQWRETRRKAKIQFIAKYNFKPTFRYLVRLPLLFLSFLFLSVLFLIYSSDFASIAFMTDSVVRLVGIFQFLSLILNKRFKIRN